MLRSCVIVLFGWQSPLQLFIYLFANSNKMGKICIKDITASKTARLSRDTHKMKHTKLYKTTQHSAIYFLSTQNANIVLLFVFEDF